jgi:hypothetical protein
MRTKIWEVGMFYRAKLAIFLISLLCVGCASSPVTSQTTANANTETIQTLDGAPLPATSVIDTKKSMIFGEGPLWTGRVEINSSMNVDDVTRFFIQQYPNQGWSFLSATKSQTSVLIFVGKQKTLVAEIQEKSFGSGSKITLTVTPTSQN